MQKKFTAKILQISDIIEWESKGEINFSPKYQRNSVWNPHAKSYLIDTIVRGMPIPPIFLHQRVDVNTRKNNREIIDGQQRLRAIIEYVSQEKFTVSKKHNQEIGGLPFSSLDEDVKREILEYELVAQVISEEEETIIYDMFSRLNSNNVVLNKQELRNAKYWGDFKVLAYQLASDYRTFLKEFGVFREVEISRMKEVEFISSLLIILIKGIVSETSKYIDDVYAEFDENFEEIYSIKEKFNNIMKDIINIFEENVRKTIFSNKNYFYSLFSIITYKNYGIIDLSKEESRDLELLFESNKDFTFNLSVFISRFETVLSKESIVKDEIRSDYEELNSLHRKHTTDRKKRVNRINLLSKLIFNQYE